MDGFIIGNNKKLKKRVKKLPLHLYWYDRNLKAIKDLSSFSQLKIIYLHSNDITTIQNLESLKNLTHLYLQWNKIEKITGLSCLLNLKKLFLGYNYIRIMQNLQNLTKLEELHIECQHLEETVEFLFDPSSLSELSHSLKLLNITKLNLTQLKPVSVLKNLLVLHASENRFSDPVELGQALGSMLFLKEANLHSCPAQKNIRYREKIIAGGRIETLDGKEITKMNRVFLKNLELLKRKTTLLKSLSESQAKNKTKNIPAEGQHTNLIRQLNIGKEPLLGYKTWKSLNVVQKTGRKPNKSKLIIVNKDDALYSLKGKNIQ